MQQTALPPPYAITRQMLAAGTGTRVSDSYLSNGFWIVPLANVLAPDAFADEDAYCAAYGRALARSRLLARVTDAEMRALLRPIPADATRLQRAPLLMEADADSPAGRAGVRLRVFYNPETGGFAALDDVYVTGFCLTEVVYVPGGGSMWAAPDGSVHLCSGVWPGRGEIRTACQTVKGLAAAAASNGGHLAAAPAAPLAPVRAARFPTPDAVAL